VKIYRVLRVGRTDWSLSGVPVNRSFHLIHKNKRSKMRTLKPQALVVTAIIVILSLLFWMAWLFLGYVADEWGSPPADSRSVPAARTY
jgi:hypothetical protein